MKEYYSLLLLPPRSFSDQVKKLKDSLLVRLGEAYRGARAPAHLSLCSFSMKAGHSNDLVSAIGRITPTLPVLQIKTGRVSSFPSTGTLFVSIGEPELFIVFQNMLVFEMRTQFPALKRSMSIPSKPHFTIAKGIASGLLPELEEEMKIGIGEEPLVMSDLRLMFKKDGKMSSFHSWKLNGQPA